MKTALAARRSADGRGGSNELTASFEPKSSCTFFRRRSITAVIDGVAMRWRGKMRFRGIPPRASSVSSGAAATRREIPRRTFRHFGVSSRRRLRSIGGAVQLTRAAHRLRQSLDFGLLLGDLRRQIEYQRHSRVRRPTTRNLIVTASPATSCLGQLVNSSCTRHNRRILYGHYNTSHYVFTVISEQICFLLFSFSVFLTLFNCRFRAVDQADSCWLSSAR